MQSRTQTPTRRTLPTCYRRIYLFWMPTVFNEQDIWTRRATLAWRRVGDEAVVLDIQGKVLRGLNLTAWHVWEMLDGTHSLGEITADVAATFAISDERAGSDVFAFVAELQRAGLIERGR